MDKTEALNSLRSQFFTDFRTGLKLPHLDTSKRYHMDDPEPQQVNSPKPELFSSPSKALNKSHIVEIKNINGAGDSFNIRNSLASEPSLSQEPSLSSIRSVTITAKSKGGGDQVEKEINQRISSVYRSIESLEKKREHFDKSLRAAARRTVADIAKNKGLKSKPSTAKNAPPKQPVETPKVTPTIRKPSRIIDVTRTYPKMFGLDPMKVIASSEDESADEGEENKSKGVRKPKKSIRKYLELLVQEDEPRDMSAIMPSLSEKTFLTKLQKRENQLNKEINDMRVNLDVMHMKADREAKKGKVEMRHPKAGTVFGKKSNITLLLADNPNKGSSRELTDFLQATGGPTGGWEPGDHQLFVQGYNKWSTNPAVLVENISRLLPNKKPADVVEHAHWHAKHEKLKNDSRSHIRKWELSKRKERENVFRMAESAKAAMEEEKHHQDLIKAKRAEELQRERQRLQNWKRSKARRSARKSAPSDEPAIDTGLRISKMDLDMSEMRKEIREITAMTKDIGKSLRSLDISDHVHKPHHVEGHQRERVSTGSEASSGFCEMTMDEIEAVNQELEGDGEKFLRKTVRITSASANNPSRDMNTHAESNKKLLQDFRARDVELLTAKKKAIENRKEKMRNKAFLTDSQIKERMKKIKAPSKLSEPTKGWMIRNEIRELEKIENQNRLNSATKEVTDSFAPVTHVSNIPKLGTPSWKKIS